MSNDVRVPFTKDNADTATLLLAAAEKHEQGQAVVRTGTGHFLVPQDVADDAGVKYDQPEASEEQAESKPAAKKTAAKKTAAKKTAAKKSASKGQE